MLVPDVTSAAVNVEVLLQGVTQGGSNSGVDSLDAEGVRNYAFRRQRSQLYVARRVQSLRLLDTT